MMTIDEATKERRTWLPVGVAPNQNEHRRSFIASPQLPFIPDALLIVPVPGKPAWVCDIRSGGTSWFAAFGEVPAEVFSMPGKTFKELMRTEPEKFRPSFELDVPIVNLGVTLEVCIRGPITGIAWWGRIIERAGP